MVEVRRALREDLPRIVDIYNQAVVHTTATFDTEPKSVEDRAAWFEEHDDRFAIFVATDRSLVVGWSCLSRWSERCAYKDTCEISVYVDESSRRRGIGALLLRTAIDHARSVHFHTILSRVAAENTASLKLHRAFEFNFVGRMCEVGWKFGRYLDVDIYQVLLA